MGGQCPETIDGWGEMEGGEGAGRGGGSGAERKRGLANGVPAV